MFSCRKLFTSLHIKTPIMKNENYVRYRKSLHSMENGTKKSFQNHIMRLSAKSRWGCQIMYKWILNKREYLGPDWPTYVWPADDITFCLIFTYFQYWCMYDLALSNTIKMTHIVWFWLTWSIKTNLTVYSEDYTMWIRTMQGLAAGSRYEPVLITYMI